MSSDPSSPVPLDDLRLERFFDAVLELREKQGSTPPDELLSELDALRGQLKSLAQHYSEELLVGCFDAFARHRFELVDSGDEYAVAAEEVLILSAVSSEAPRLCIPTLQQSVVALSSVLGEAGVVQQFGNLLRRLRQLARQTDDPELKAWLAGVAGALPGEPASEEPA